jgi:RNA polymerase sigma-70 factor, ECF subfamily
MKPSVEEFERLALEQLDLLYRVAHRLTRDKDKASDLVQETYLRAFRGRERFDLQGVGIRPWLIRIMHNLQVTRGQRESRQPGRIEDDALEAAEARPIVSGEKFSPQHFDHMDERLVRALGDLPEDYQVVLLLWAVDELSYKEIAEALEVPIGTVMSRLHRARQRLAGPLRELGEEQGFIRE